MSLLSHTALYCSHTSDLITLSLRVLTDQISSVAPEWDTPAIFLSLKMAKLQPCLKQRDFHKFFPSRLIVTDFFHIEECSHSCQGDNCWHNFALVFGGLGQSVAFQRIVHSCRCSTLAD